MGRSQGARCSREVRQTVSVSCQRVFLSNEIPNLALLEMKRESPICCEASCHTVLTFSKRFHRRSHFTALHVPALFHASLETTWQTATCANAARQANALHRLVFTHEERVLSLPSSHLRAVVWLAIRQKYANLNANVSATNACSLPLH